jgi:proline iminopeptidase
LPILPKVSPLHGRIADLGLVRGSVIGLRASRAIVVVSQVRRSTFVDEVEQVRTALGLDRDNFFLYGQSWGGLLALEYALAHQQNLKGLIISNMMASVPTHNDYAANVLMPQMDQYALTEIKQLEAARRNREPTL